MKFNPGDKIEIKIDGKPVMTWIDPHGVQRLPYSPLLSALFDCGALSLDTMVIAYHNKKISFDHMLEYYLSIGYSVSGFADLSIFEHLSIENPLWEE